MDGGDDGTHPDEEVAGDLPVPAMFSEAAE
jgi:hypothetical protein